MRMRLFDTTDIDAAKAREVELEQRLARAHELRARGFAQGFTAALEDGNAVEWLDLYQEREA